MNKSEQIDMLATSLSKFQGEIHNIFKGKKGYGYNYADLASILEDVRPILFKHGLAVVQLAGNSGDSVSIETVLMHSSGQYISEVILMPVDVGKGMTRAQAIGSVISYARRYSLTSALGIAQTDTDGREPVEEEIKPTMAQKSAYTSKHQPASEEAFNKLMSLIKELNIEQREIDNWCKKANATGLKTMASDKFDMLVSMLERRKEIAKKTGGNHVEQD